VGPGPGPLEPFGILQQKLARPTSPEKVKGPPEDGVGADALFGGESRREADLARKVVKIIFLEGEEHFIELKGSHGSKVLGQVLSILLAQVRNTGAHGGLLSGRFLAMSMGQRYGV